MTIRYEINPPKVSDPPSRIELLDERIEQISKFCDGIHVTDSVLGIERISPLLIGAEIKQKHPKLNVTISLRVTQVVHDISQVKRLHDYLNPKNFEIIPCLLFPSQKNSRSAQFLNLDWSNYEDNFSSFVLEIESITGDVLLTSPNDFKGALDFLTRLQN